MHVKFDATFALLPPRDAVLCRTLCDRLLNDSNLCTPKEPDMGENRSWPYARRSDTP